MEIFLFPNSLCYSIPYSVTNLIKLAWLVYAKLIPFMLLRKIVCRTVQNNLASLQREMNANFLHTLSASSNNIVLLLSFKLGNPLNWSWNGPNCLQVAESRFQPQLIVYNAGTDILDGDPLGRLKVCPFVWTKHSHNIHVTWRYTYLQWLVVVLTDPLNNALAGSFLLILCLHNFPG